MFRRKKDKVAAVFACPHCGAIIPATSPACPECGSDAETGWSRAGNLADAYHETADVSRKRPSPFVKKLLKYGGTALGTLAATALVAYTLPYGIWFALALVGVVVVVLFISRERSPSPKALERTLEKELFALSGRDPARVERLLMFERNRKPDAPRVQLIQDAIDRLLRDRR